MPFVVHGGATGVCGRYEALTRSCFGGTGLARLELALIAFVDGSKGPAVAQVAGPNDERGVGLDQFKAVGAAWTGHCKDGERTDGQTMAIERERLWICVSESRE